MRVFTHRFHAEIEQLPWQKPALGVYPEYDAWIAEFSSIYPNSVLLENHELDYKVAFKTPSGDTFYIVGFYWGDETKLPAANHWINNNKVLDGMQRRWVVTCDDTDHPAIGPAANMQIDDFLTSVQAVKQGYYLWSDPDTMKTD
jgi:hypothetical protein